MVMLRVDLKTVEDQISILQTFFIAQLVSTDLTYLLPVIYIIYCVPKHTEMHSLLCC